jgi:hypothetical protein
MPHTILWGPADWAAAIDALELVVRANREDAPVSVWGELRQRERAMGAVWEARQSQRLRYVPPAPDDGPDAAIADLDSYRNL